MYFRTYLAAALAGLCATADARSVSARRVSQRSLETREIFDDVSVSFFTQQGTYGSCGQLHEDNEHVVAMSYKLMGLDYPAPYCGRKVQITHQGADRDQEGNPRDKVVVATVVDTCTTCDSPALEVSVATFESLMGGTYDRPGPANRISWQML